MLLLGTEPSLRWRTFAALVTGLATDLGVSLVVTLGSLLADVPHTRPAPVTASATDPALARAARPPGLPLRGPDRVVGVLHDACRAGGHPVGVALGGGAPLRLADAVAARGQGALRPARRLLDVPLDTTELDEASEAYMQQVSEAVAADEETAAYVDELESRVDEADRRGDLPSGDALAAELTRFLREREQDDDEPGRPRRPVALSRYPNVNA